MKEYTALERHKHKNMKSLHIKIASKNSIVEEIVENNFP